MKKRKEKSMEYENKYSGIPLDYEERLYWLCDRYNIGEKKQNEILEKRNQMLTTLQYSEIGIVLYEEPEGSPRPRFRFVNRYNACSTALSDPGFVHVYSPVGAEDNLFMKRLLTQQEMLSIHHLIYTPCDIEICTFHRTPSSFNQVDVFLAEIGLHRPPVKPDWDNMGKKYCDMFNKNIWLDDSLVIDGTVRKFFSVLPRVEIKLKYLNMLYTKQQYNSIIKRIDVDDKIDLTYFGRNNS